MSMGLLDTPPSRLVLLAPIITCHVVKVPLFLMIRGANTATTSSRPSSVMGLMVLLREQALGMLIFILAW